MKYLKLYESHFVGYTPDEKKLIISEIEDLIIDILELPELFDYKILFPKNEIFTEARINLSFNKSKDINKIILSDINRLINLLDIYFFYFDVTLYNDKGGVYNPNTGITTKSMLQILKDNYYSIYNIQIYMIPSK